MVVCDAEFDKQDVEVISWLAKSLSSNFACLALAALNHDDDLFWFQIFLDGALMDEYNSTPDLFDAHPARGPIGGNAARLASIFDRPGKTSTLDKILHKTDYVFAVQRHEALARALRLPWPAVGLGYKELNEGDTTPSDASDNVKMPDQAWLLQFTRPDEITEPFDLAKEVRKLVSQNKRISAMDLYRRHTGCTLQEARKYIESL